jgi:phospholipase/carboxylesterase
MTSHDLLPCVELGPEQARASVIWLHGLGASGHDFEPIVPELGLPDSAAIRFVFPHAPPQPVTINGGMVMPAWYDIVSADFTRHEDAAGIRRSQQRLEHLIAREQERGVPAGHIVLAGFSQGGAIALHTGLRYPQRLAGILALSTYLPLADTLGAEASPANHELPIFMAHGLYDPLVPIELARASCERLRQAGYDPEWHTYAMEHTVCAEEIRDIGQWLRRILVAAGVIVEG